MDLCEKVDVFVFDFDGVLIDSTNLMIEILQEIKDENLLDFLPCEILKYQGLPINCVFKNMGIPIELIPKYESKASRYASKIKLSDNVLEILNYLKKRNRIMYLFTGKSTKRTVELLNIHGLISFFTELFCGDSKYMPKPNSDVLKHISNLHHGSNIIYFGDSIYDYLCTIDTDVNFMVINKAILLRNYFPEVGYE